MVTMWAVSATVRTRDEGGIFVGSRQVPTFYLNPDVQGIIFSHHAKAVAREIIDPLHITKPQDITIHVERVMLSHN